jgi:glycosyltransferase involved in cell wall biosynthesis
MHSRSNHIAIVIPVFNRKLSVLATLDSILNQDLPVDWVIIVDDGSTDNSVVSIQRWIDQNTPGFRHKLLRQANSGPAVARNRGLREVKDLAAAVLFLDSDDRLPKDFVSRTSSVLFGDDDIIAVSTDQRYHGTNVRLRSTAGLAEDPCLWILQNDGGVSSCTLLRTDAIVRLGGYREDLFTGADTNLFFRLGQSGYWRHSSGTPVEMYMHTSATGEEGNLSRKFRDCFLRWAKIFEELVMDDRGHKFPDKKVYAKEMARWWQMAFKHHPRNAEESTNLLFIQSRIEFWDAIHYGED